MGYLQEQGTPLCIDEIQYAPELLRSIKLIVDEADRPSLYWLTCSQRFHMLKDASENLAGRVGIVELSTLSQQEANREASAPDFFPTIDRLRELTPDRRSCDINELYARIWRGEYPALHRNQNRNLNHYFDSYLQTYLERDVQALTQVGNKETPKLYFMDTGLCAWLCNWTSPATLQTGALSGAILETWVFGQLYRALGNRGTRSRLSYYRDSNGSEEDFLLEHEGKIYPMEVKRNSNPTHEALKAASGIPAGSAAMQPGIVLCSAREMFGLGKEHFAFPISAMLRGGSLGVLSRVHGRGAGAEKLLRVTFLLVFKQKAGRMVA